MRPTTLSSVVLFISAIACEPVQPGLGGGPAPLDGEWRMRIVNVDSMGRCGLLRDSDLEGLVMGMEVATRDDWGIRLDIEGMELKGNMDSGQIYAQGHLIEEQVVIGGEDRDVPVDTDVEEPDHGESSDSSDSARTPQPPSDYEPMQYAGIHTELVASTITRSMMEGELVIEYDQSNAGCVLILDFEATHMNVGEEREEPIITTSEPAKPVVDEGEDVPLEG